MIRLPTRSLVTACDGKLRLFVLLMTLGLKSRTKLMTNDS